MSSKNKTSTTLSANNNNSATRNPGAHKKESAKLFQLALDRDLIEEITGPSGEARYKLTDIGREYIWPESEQE